MGRKKKDVDPAVKPAKSNGYDPDKVNNAVARIETLKADIASIMGNALNECRSIHQDIKAVYQEAKDAHGIPKKALRSVIKAREFERKAEQVREDLEGDDQNDFDLIRHALGDLADTPLGKAALVEDVRPAFLQRQEEDRNAATNGGA